ncbi:MAG: GNAT family N-acetyltransferase [Chloroflexi bacterium]|nr:GNAT family N-acetyltransferase [Chloroflexota bacterium]
MLKGRIVNLRARELADAERMHRWINDREVTATLGNRYLWSLAAEEEFLRGQTSRPPSFPDQSFAIETKDGRHIGTTGLHRASPENRNAEMGIMVGEKDCWSRGYGTDALITLLRFAFGEMNLHRVELHVYADNERGIACYRKCGFVEEVCLRQFRYRNGQWIDGLEMGVLVHEFEALHGLGAKEETHA